MVPISEFGIAVLALAEHRRVKPAEWLRDLIGCTPQAANRYIRGKRRAPWLAFAAAVDRSPERRREAAAGPLRAPGGARSWKIRPDR